LALLGAGGAAPASIWATRNPALPQRCLAPLALDRRNRRPWRRLAAALGAAGRRAAATAMAATASRR
jgi:shikimate 5-dehydrogenase